MQRVLADPHLITSHDEMSLLLNASISHASTAQFTYSLLEAGASPNDQITVRYGDVIRTRDGHTQRLHDDKQSTTVFAVFLFALAQMHFQKWIRPDDATLFGNLEEFFRVGADCDVYFLLKAPGHPASSEEDEEFQGHEVSEETEGTGNRSDKNNLLFVSLEDLILLYRPSNMDFLMKHILQHRGRWPWRSAKQVVTTALSALRLGNTDGDDSDERKYRRLQLGSVDSIRGKYFVKTVCVNGRRLERGFSVRMF
jgi:hypothetical protein